MGPKFSLGVTRPLDAPSRKILYFTTGNGGFNYNFLALVVFEAP